MAAYDEDAYLSVSALLGMKTCNGRIGATGMCLGGHLAYRCAFDNRVAAAVCYFATDIHSHSLGQGKNDDSLDRAGDIRSELVMVRFFFFFPFFSPSPLHFQSHDEIKTWVGGNADSCGHNSCTDLWQKRQPRSPRRKGLDT